MQEGRYGGTSEPRQSLTKDQGQERLHADALASAMTCSGSCSFCKSSGAVRQENFSDGAELPPKAGRGRAEDATKGWLLCGDGFKWGAESVQICAEGQETAVAILQDKLAGVPGCVVEFTRELNIFGGELGIEGVRIVDVEVGVEQFVGVFVRIGGGRLGAAKVEACRSRATMA